MTEVRIARFTHRWEAEFAQGYLEDAGIPSRLVGDGAGGSQPYVGGLAGASLLVSAQDQSEARGVLEQAGILTGPEGVEPTAVPTRAAPDLTPMDRADHDDLVHRLESARKSELRHGLRAVLGVTPAAAIPLIGLALEGNGALLAVLSVLVVSVEGWRWIQAGRRARALQIEIALLEEEAAGE